MTALSIPAFAGREALPCRDTLFTCAKCGRERPKATRNQRYCLGACQREAQRDNDRRHAEKRQRGINEVRK